MEFSKPVILEVRGGKGRMGRTLNLPISLTRRNERSLCVWGGGRGGGDGPCVSL